MRLPFCLSLLALAACSGAEGDDAPAANTSASSREDRIECALAGADRFAPDCSVERAERTMTVRHPDGGFRRLLIADDGGVIAADGAAPAAARVIGAGRMEIAVDGDRYRLPVPGR